MENNPEAPVAPEAKSVATPNTNDSAEAQTPAAPDMHGFTSEQLADMKKFFDNNGGFDAVKSKISNPEPKPVEQPADKPVEQPVNRPQEPAYVAPEGSITAQEFLAKQYFGALAQEEKYAGIAKEIANGDLLKEMASFNIQALNRDGSINDQMVRRYLDLKAQTVPAKQSSMEPGASSAPTVEYVQVGEQINSLNEAYAVIRQDTQLKQSGMAGHPSVAKAEEYIKTHLNPEKK